MNASSMVHFLADKLILLLLGTWIYGWFGSYGMVRPLKTETYIENIRQNELPLYYFSSTIDYQLANRIF